MTGPWEVALEGHLDAFIAFLRVERGLSAKTVDAYASDLTTYFEDLRGRGLHDPTRVTGEVVTGHLAHLGRRGLGRRSQARHLAAIRGFHRFLVAERLAQKDPTEDLDTPRAASRLPLFLTLDEVEALLAASEGPSAASQRDAAMLETLYASGLRVSELIGLGVNDVQLTAGYLVAKGKGAKERIVPLGRKAIEKLQSYLGGPREALLRGRRSRALFVTPRGGPFTRMGFWKLLRRYALKAGIKKPLSHVDCANQHLALYQRLIAERGMPTPANRAAAPMIA